MKVILCSLLALSLIRSASLPAHGETERQRRGPIRYDERVQWDQLDPSIRVRGDQETQLLRVPERREADYSDRNGSFFTMDPSILSAPPPPPPVREESDQQRNWLLPSLGEDFGLSGEEVEEEREPSGWGWLADEVNERRQAARDAQEEEEEEEALQDDEKNFWSPQETDLFGGVQLTFTPVLADRAGDSEGERRDTLATLDSREAERLDEMSLEALEELLRDQESTDQWDSPDEDDPWGDDRLRESATSPFNSERTSSERFTGSRFRERERVDEGRRRQSGFNNRTETRISAGHLDQPEETSSFSPSADRDSGDRTFRGTETGASFDSSFHTPRDNGIGRDSESINAGSMYTPSRESTSGWGGNWTSDSDWQGTSPTTTPDRTRPSPATPPTPHSDWLSDPGW